jgi:4-hydroxy-2-oxoheptanedioate aldolase
MTTWIEQLRAGKPQLGLCVMYPAPGVVERIGPDWDWLWIDGQHGELAYSDILALVRACDFVQRPSLVRVPSHEYGAIGMALDTGATGVIVPVVDTVEQARAVVHAARFPPIGGRSYGGRRPVDRWGRGYSETANQNTVLVVQIESPEAVENAAAIAAVPGVDGIFLGPDDILMRRGVSPTAPRTRELLGADMERVSRAAKAAGKFAAVPAVGPDALKLALSYGFTLLVGGGDVPFLANTSKKASDDARAILAQTKPAPPPAGAATGSAY